MSNVLSFFGLGGDKSSPLPGLNAARKLLAQISKNDRSDYIALLSKALKKHSDIAASFAWLHVYERRFADDNTAMAVLATLLDGPMFSPAQHQRSAMAAAPELEKALRDDSVPDEIKITFPPLLALAGRPVDEHSVQGYFRNFAAALRQQGLEFSRNLSDSPSSLAKLLLANQFISDEENEDHAPISVESATELMILGSQAAETNPAGATLMAAALIFRLGAPDFSNERSPGQLDAIYALATPRARWCLETLANWPGFAMPFRHKAARLAEDLASREIESQAPLAPGEFSHALVSMTDGMGSRTMTLFHRTPDGGLDAFNAMLNDEVGVKDVFAFFGNGDEMEYMLRNNPHQISVANAPFPLIRELLADAFTLHEELGTAPPGKLFPLMAYLGDEPVKPRKREPNLDAYTLETLRPTPDLVSGGAELAKNLLFGSLFPASDAAYAFCAAHWDTKRKSIKETDFSAFLEEVMPLERNSILRRMAVNLEVEALAGRAGNKDNQKAARLWLGMKENVVPFWTVPFIQKLADIGVHAISEDLRRGYKNQREAFIAEEELVGKELDQALGFPLSELDMDALSEEEQKNLVGGLLGKLLGGETNSRQKAKSKKKTAKHGLESGGGSSEKAKSPASGKKGSTRDRNIYRLTVELIGYPPTVEYFMRNNPVVIREIEIAGDQTLEKLHLAIFKAFEREDQHAYEFQLSDKPMDPGASRYVHPQVMDDDSDSDLVHNAATTTLDDLGLEAGQTFLYWFDFGDDWWHGIRVLEVGPPLARRRYPRVAAKRGVSPPQYPLI